MIIALRLVLVVMLLGGFILNARPRAMDPSRASHRLALIKACRACRRAMRILGIHLRIHGKHHDQARLQVSNHLSYVDAIVLMAVRPTLFITSTEVRRDPLLGRVAYAGGCDFVDRRSIANLREECARIARHLSQVPVLVFPEGTSSDGSGVLPFRPAFFTSALEAGGAIQPLCIRSPAIDNRPFGRHNHARVCWYGDMGFAPHLLQLLSVRRLDAAVTYLEPIAVGDNNRKQLAAAAHQAISALTAR